MAHRGVYIDHLQNLTLFVACSRKDLQHIARRAKNAQVAAGTAIINEGEHGNEFFVILDGTALVHRDGRKVATLGPGNAFGELALLGDAPRNATVVAETDAELVVVSEPDFTGLLDEVPGFARKLLAGTAHRLREADARSIQ